jgi:hypothetical protein
MVFFTMELLTPEYEINSANMIIIQFGKDTMGISSDMVKHFVRSVREGVHEFEDKTEEQLLEIGLQVCIPPELRIVFHFLYFQLRTIVEEDENYDEYNDNNFYEEYDDE